MQTIINNPKNGIYAASSDYVHGIEIRDPARWLYVAGTMGLRPDGSAPESLEEQLELIWRNIGVILAGANMAFDNIVRVTSYLRDPSYAELNGQARKRALGSRRVPTTAIVAETLSAEWLVEIEVVAVA
jgi:enamine deaminase RidA (YjgF/YER057c/UK114 family)